MNKASLGILFVWIVMRFFREGQPNVIKFSAFLFLWMFVLTTVLPVERFILQANLGLAERPDSRIRLFELTMLSPDVLASVERLVARDAQKCASASEQDKFVSRDFCGWEKWLEERRARMIEKKWYERNLTNLIYLTRK